MAWLLGQSAGPSGLAAHPSPHHGPFLPAEPWSPPTPSTAPCLTAAASTRPAEPEVWVRAGDPTAATPPLGVAIEGQPHLPIPESRKPCPWTPALVWGRVSAQTHPGPQALSSFPRRFAIPVDGSRLLSSSPLRCPGPPPPLP